MQDKRDEFLLHMYDSFWNNVSRAEEAVWKMVAAYSALIAGTAIARPLITTTGAAMLIMFFGCVASCLAANSNLWYRRNLTMIGRLEGNFLRDSDYGRLIPKAWKSHRRFWTSEYWSVLCLAYLVVSLITSLLIMSVSMTPDEAQKIVSLSSLRAFDIFVSITIITIALTVIYIFMQWKNYRWFLQKTSE